MDNPPFTRPKSPFPDESEDDPELYPDDDPLADDAESMSFLDHLEAFRWTLIYSLIAFFVGAGIVAVFLGDIASILQYPLSRAYGSLELAQQNLINYRPMGVFSVILQVIFLGGLILSLPFVLYFLARFVAPALKPEELRVVKPSCLFALCLFLMGVAFSFFVVLPLSLAVAVRFNRYLGIDLLLAASEYYSLVVWFSVAMGAFFQFPLIILLLVHLGVVSTAMLRRFRRHVFLALAIFSALITPGGDPVTLMVMAGPMYLFYELSILAGARMERKRMLTADL